MTRKVGRPRREVPRYKRAVYMTEALWEALSMVAIQRAVRLRTKLSVSDVVEQIALQDSEVAREVRRIQAREAA